MLYEFLPTFGETLGFDMESLPLLDRIDSDAEGVCPALYGEQSAAEQCRHRADRRSHRKTKHGQAGGSWTNQETEDSAIEETPEFARLVDEFGGCQSRSLGRLYDTRRDDPFGQRKQQKEEAVETEEHPEEAGSEADDSTESPTKATK